MIAWIKANRVAIAIVCAAWFGIGVLFGAATTANERSDFKTECIPNNHGGCDTKVIDTSHSGCIYRSLSAILNPGYIVGCELFRRRFEYEGIDQVLGGKK